MWSAVVDNLVQRPHFAGRWDGVTHEGVAGTPGEGPHLRLWLQMEQDTIARAGYQTYGCPAAIASGEMLCLLLSGRTRERAQLLTAEDLTRALNGLPEGKAHCPQLAITALRHALSAERCGAELEGDAEEITNVSGGTRA